MSQWDFRLFYYHPSSIFILLAKVDWLIINLCSFCLFIGLLMKRSRAVQCQNEIFFNFVLFIGHKLVNHNQYDILPLQK